MRDHQAKPAVSVWYPTDIPLYFLRGIRYDMIWRDIRQYDMQKKRRIVSG